jgi:hypothetical protein
VKKLPIILLSLLVAGLAACGDSNEPPPIPSQHWQEMDVRIETHPNPPTAGMSEIVVIVTGPHGRPVHDLTISFRANDSAQWAQAIQDGYMGVYRRATNIGSGKEAELQVRLLRGSEQIIMLFPLKLADG